MNATHTNTDRSRNLRTIRRLAEQWLRGNEQRLVAEAAMEEAREAAQAAGKHPDDSPMFRLREAQHDLICDRVENTYDTLADLLGQANATAPRYIRVGNLIIALTSAPHFLSGNDDQLSIIDLGQPAMKTSK